MTDQTKHDIGGLQTENKAKRHELEKLQNEMDVDEDIYLDENNIQKTPEGQVLDKLHLTKMCCRRHMLTHVDIE